MYLQFLFYAQRTRYEFGAIARTTNDDILGTHSGYRGRWICICPRYFSLLLKQMTILLIRPCRG